MTTHSTSPQLYISSLSNPRVKDIVRLRRRSHRDDEKVLLTEGYREVKRALDNGYAPYALYICRELFMGEHEDAIIAGAAGAGAEIVSCAKNVFMKLSARDRPDGLLMTGPQISRSLESLSLPENALVIVAEAIEKPGNLGTILRSADAAGVSAVFVCDHCTDVQNPNVVRASIGALFAVPVVDVSSDEAIDFLKRGGFTILSSTPHAEAFYSDFDLTGPTAIVVGSEQYGLSDKWMKAANALARIPMLGQCDSLNVASATTILLFEAVRQRVSKDRRIVPVPHIHEHTSHHTASSD